MRLSTYKDLLCKLNTEISNLVQSFCRSETYGYRTCKDKLQKLIYTKQLLENNIHTLVEKPLSLTEFENKQILKLIRKTKNLINLLLK